MEIVLIFIGGDVVAVFFSAFSCSSTRCNFVNWPATSMPVTSLLTDASCRSLLVAVMLGSMRKSVQIELDEFFVHLEERTQLVRRVSKLTVAKARAKQAIPGLNDWFVARDGVGGKRPMCRNAMAQKQC